MPKISKNFTLEITPEQFLDNCSGCELQELQILLSSPRYQIKMDASTCRECGCTDDDCRECIEKTGHACHWVESDLCSACAHPDPSEGKIHLLTIKRKEAPLPPNQ